jgi:hypothetical protein
MRRAPSVVLLGAVVGLCATGSVSRGDTPSAPKEKTQPLHIEKRNSGVDSLVQAGRTRMKQGDWKGALDAFDGALRVTFDPTVARDRGICNEKLGYPFPAIDDYRAYLTQRPDAADADAIRQRLARLEGNGDESDSPDAPPPSKEPRQAKGADGRSASEDPGEDPNGDKLGFSSRDDSIYTSSLRAGTGVGLYPFFAEHKWFSSAGGSFGDPSSWSESIGVGFRYSLNASGSLVVEAGYERFNTTDSGLVSYSGLTSLVAYELRFKMDPAYTSQLFLAPGVGYEHLSLASSDASVPSNQAGAIVPRVRFGYRRMIGHATSFDVSVDAGATEMFDYSGPSLIPNGDPTLILVAANVAFVWGI